LTTYPSHKLVYLSTFNTEAVHIRVEAFILAMLSLQEVKAALKEPIADLAILQDHLSTIVERIHSSPSDTAFEKSIAAIQVLLLENVLPTWSAVVEENKELRALLEECFAPRAERTTNESNRTTETGRRFLATAYSGHQTLSSSLSSTKTGPQLLPLIIHLTTTLVDRYSLSDLWTYAFNPLKSSERGGAFVWEQAVKLVVAVPARTMNAYGRAREAGTAVEVESVDRLNGR
jgi:hypothetical protein